MITQTPIKSFVLLEFIVSQEMPELVPAQPVRVNSLDYGFDHDEDELGQGLLAAGVDTAADQPVADIDAGEFDALYKWFIS